MKSNQEEIEKMNKKELQQITKKIIEKFQLSDYNFALRISKALYKNGITLDMLTEENYKGPLNLEQIILYLIQKEERKNKIIPIRPESETKIYHINRKNSRK